MRDPMFSRFDTIPECDRQTHRHTTTAYTALSIASRGKNYNYRLSEIDDQRFWPVGTGFIIMCLFSHVERLRDSVSGTCRLDRLYRLHRLRTALRRRGHSLSHLLHQQLLASWNGCQPRRHLAQVYTFYFVCLRNRCFISARRYVIAR